MSSPAASVRCSPSRRSAPSQPRTQPPPSRLSLQAIAQRSLAANLAAVLAWIDGLGGLGRDGKSLDVTGFDGKDLTEIGISNGSLTVHDRRDGLEWSFKQLTMSLIRPASGGVTLIDGLGEPGEALAAQRRAHAPPRRQPPVPASGAQGAVRQSVRAAHDRKRASLRHGGVGRDRRQSRPRRHAAGRAGHGARRERRDRLPGPA